MDGGFRGGLGDGQWLVKGCERDVMERGWFLAIDVLPETN
jgi:hypothetical protein